MKLKYLAYLFFVILIAIPSFDKEDNLFPLQLFCVALIGLFAFLGWRQERKNKVE